MRWDLKHFLICESLFQLLGGAAPQIPMALQEVATFTQLPGAGKESGVPGSVLCCV